MKYKEWTVEHYGLLDGKHRYDIYSGSDIIAMDVGEANARLISAAPDLYEALKFVANQIIAWTDFRPELTSYTKLAVKTIDEALAKAK